MIVSRRRSISNLDLTLKMRSERYILLFIFYFTFLTTATAQQRLRVGSKIPDIELKNVMNFSDSKIRLSNFYGKLIIFDFWSHSCKACIESFPALDSLQNKFRDKLQIILINKETEDSTRSFFAKRKTFFLPKIPMVTGDTKLSDYFPTYKYPFHVWVDKGVVQYLSDTYNTTSEHIESYLRGETNIFDNRNEKPKVYSSLIALGNENWENDILYCSYISRCSKAIDIGNYTGLRFANGRSTRLSENCSSVLELYKKAYGEGGKYNFNINGSVVLNVKDSFQYLSPKDKNLLGSWFEKYSFSYDLILPTIKRDGMYSIMQKDLDRYFNIKATIVKKTMKALVLVRKRNGENVGGKPEETSFVPTEKNKQDSVLHFRNITFSRFSDLLRGWLSSSIFFFDETNYSGTIDININKKLISPFKLEEMRAILQRYNLDLVDGEREVDVLVIEEK
jgi:thiol-disulfide isomerase/thioredoxin